VKDEAWTVGAEHDETERARLRVAVESLGYRPKGQWWGVGGSQEITHVELVGPAGQIEVEAETYIGLTVKGDSNAIAAIRAAMESGTGSQAHGAGISMSTGSSYLAAIVAGVFIVLGVAAAAVPDTVIAASRYWVSSVGIFAAAVLRCGIGIALLIVARGSRAPAILGIMGVALLVAGFALPLLGVDNAMTRVEWEAGHMTFLRLEGVLFVWAGYVVYKLSERRVGERSTPSLRHLTP